MMAWCVWLPGGGADITILDDDSLPGDKFSHWLYVKKAFISKSGQPCEDGLDMINWHLCTFGGIT